MPVRGSAPVEAPKPKPGAASVPKEARLWMPLNALRAFEAVGEQLSFTAAAAALHISQSALSRHVSRLEEHIGCRLLERRPQGLALTAAGAALLPAVVKSFDRIEATMELLRRKAGTGQRMLRVHMPPTFLRVAGMSLLRDFRLAFPDISIDLFSTNGVGMPSRPCDIGVIFDRPKLDDAVRDPLWMVSQTPACSPELAERCSQMTLATFLKENELLHTRLEGEPFGLNWSVYVGQIGLSIPVETGLAFDSEALAVEWALAGNGIVLVDVEMFSKEVAEGRLVTPYATTCDSGFGYYLTVHPDDIADPAIALFRSWVIERFTRVQSGALRRSEG